MKRANPISMIQNKMSNSQALVSKKNQCRSEGQADNQVLLRYLEFRKRCFWIGTLVILTTFSGCGQEQEKRPETIQVQGKITHNGKPLEKGRVTFSPLDSGDDGLRRPASGSIQSDGTFQLSTFQSNDGALPGDYQVVIVSYENEPSPEEIAEGNAEFTWAIPEKYGNPLTSGLIAKVPGDGEEPVELSFDLSQ